MSSPRSSESPIQKSKKRKPDEAATPIKSFFPVVKRCQNQADAIANVSNKLSEEMDLDSPGAGVSNAGESFHTTEQEEFDEAALRRLLDLQPKTKRTRKEVDRDKDKGYEQSSTWPKTPTPLGIFDVLKPALRTKLLHSCSLYSLAMLAETSMSWSRILKEYVASSVFIRRFQRDHLHSSQNNRLYGEEVFFGLGLLLKSITIEFATPVRAAVLLNVCRNLHALLGSLQGFGRVIESMTLQWEFGERRYAVKAAICIDPSLPETLAIVMLGAPGEHPDMELKVKKAMRGLFLGSATIPQSRESEEEDLGAWTSIVVRHFKVCYQARMFYILFGPTLSGTSGLSCVNDRILWDALCDDEEEDVAGAEIQGQEERNSTSQRRVRLFDGKCHLYMRSITSALKLLALCRQDEFSRRVAWSDEDIYLLFNRLQDCGPRRWGETAEVVAYAMNPDVVFKQYLMRHLDRTHDGYRTRLARAANMVCLVRWFLVLWKKDPSVVMQGAMHAALNHLARSDGPAQCESFIENIWKTYQKRVTVFFTNAKDYPTGTASVEMNGHANLLPLLDRFSGVLLEINADERAENAEGDE